MSSDNEEEKPLISLQQFEGNLDDKKKIIYKNIDEVIEKLGGFGRYQLFLIILAFLAVGLNGYQTLLIFFVANNPGWQCKNVSTNQSLFCQKNMGKTFDASHPDFYKRCSLERSEWQYTKPSTYSIVTEYDLVCSKAYIAALSNSMFFACGTVGSILSGFLGDKYGRKYPCCVAIFALSLSSLISGFVNNVWVFVLFRGIIGVLFYSINNLAYILFTEIVLPKYRPFLTALFPISATLSVSLLSLVASVVQEWRKLILYTSLPGFTIAFACFFVYRSPRWLFSRSPEKAKQVIMKIAAFNKISLGDFDIKLDKDFTHDSHYQYSYKDMFTSSLKAVITIMSLFFIWLISYLTYFAIGYQSANLGGNIYYDLFVMFLADIPGYILLGIFYRFFGHRKIIQYSSISVALFIIPIISLPQNLPNLHTYRVVFFMICKMFSTIITTSVYSWSFEIYPTVVRAQGMTICTIGVGIGSALTPILLYYPALVWIRLPVLMMCFLALVTAFFAFMLPETRGKPTREKFHELVE